MYKRIKQENNPIKCLLSILNAITNNSRQNVTFYFFSHKRRVFVTKNVPLYTNIYTLRKAIKNKTTITRE